MTKELPRLKHVSSKHIEGISDLVVVAPIKEGFIDAFEHVSYETRLKMTMEALFRMRSTSREFNLFKPLLDTTEKIQSLRSYRLAVIDVTTELEVVKKLVLAVTFDKPFEPYIREIWWPLGPMLDVLFCNCDHYVPAVDNSYEAYLRWLRRYQVDSGFFYATTNLSVVDFQYLVQIEKLHREGKGRKVDLEAIKTIAIDPKAVAKKVRQDQIAETNDIAFDALGGLYRLASFYPVDRPAREGRFLWRAAQSLLDGWTVPPDVPPRFHERLEWYQNEEFDKAPDPDSVPKPNTPAASEPSSQPLPEPGTKANVQGGILTGYDKRDPERPITHGAMLLMQVTHPGRAREFLKRLTPRISTEDSTAPPKDGIYLNIAFTHRGLRQLEVPALELRRFPQEFVEGAEERAGLIGDVMQNHPRRWRLPERNWPRRSPLAPAGPRPRPRPPVEMAEVDLVVPLRTACPEKPEKFDVFDPQGAVDREHPLARRVEAMARWAGSYGVRLVSVQPMQSRPREEKPFDLPPDDPASSYITREHFGFVDGFSQPVVDDDGKAGRDSVRRGEMLLGYPNDRGDESPQPNPYLDDGSFLVVRKIRQHVDALEKWLAAECAAASGLKADDLAAKMMGRTRDGDALFKTVPPGKNENDFDYQRAAASACPFPSHIRRANPRTPPPEDPAERARFRPVPRIMRRGMSYGPSFDRHVVERPEAERGLVFMCYQSSIAEQYEVIQRWLNGGNSSGVGAAQNDPLTGVGRPGDRRVFRWASDTGKHRLVRFLNRPKAFRHKVDDEKGRNPFVTLEWLLYLFTPSIRTIDKIAAGPRETHQAELDAGRKRILDLGRTIIDKLQVAEQLLNAQNEFQFLLWARYYGINWLADPKKRPELPRLNRWARMDTLQASTQGHNLPVWKKFVRFGLILFSLVLTGWRLLRRKLFPRDLAFQRLRGRMLDDNPEPKPYPLVDRFWMWFRFLIPRRFLKWLIRRRVVKWPILRWVMKWLIRRRVMKWLFPKIGDFDHLAKVAWIWKGFLEDFGAKDPGERGWGIALWATIRKDHGGVIRVPYGDLVVKDKDPPAEEIPGEDEDLEKAPENWDPEKGKKRHKPVEKVVLVARHDLVNEVYRNWKLYSVEGEGPRMNRSFGQIYIGRDPGRKYDEESTFTNNILMGIGEKEAFADAHRIARAILDDAFANARVEPIRSVGAAAARPSTKLELTSQFITPALADLCSYWFGIPDSAGEFVESGTWRRKEFDISETSRCPGDFMAPSRYFFYPDPNPAVQHYGRELGQRLHRNVLAFVKHARTSPPAASIAQRMLDEIDDNALVARNLIGIMMGMLPPADGNLRGVLHGWLKDNMIWRVQDALAARPESDPYVRAQRALEKPLKEAMQKRPAPDMVWRTATRGHWLGKEKGKRVYVRAGERVFVGIVSATMENRGKGGHDVYPIFGGLREPLNGQPAPVHACPAYAMGMGMLMGIVTALLESGTIETTPGPLSVQLTKH